MWSTMYSSTITTTKLFLTISTLESTTTTENREQRTENSDSRGEERADSAEEQRAVSIEQRAESRGQWSSGKSLKRKREQAQQGAGEAWDEEEDGKIRKKMRISSNNMAPPHDQVEPMEVD